MSARIRRRELLVGVASVAILPALAGTAQLQIPAPGSDGDLNAMGLQFRRLVERILVLEQRKTRLASSSMGLNAGIIHPEYQTAWKAWSDAIAEAEALAIQMHHHPARSLLDLSLKFEALIWEVSNDGPDESSIDKLRVWGDDLRQMTGTEQAPNQFQLLDTHS